MTFLAQSVPPERSSESPRHRLVPELGLGGCLIQSSAQFVADFEPPEYVIDNIAQRRYVYSVTRIDWGRKDGDPAFYIGSCRTWARHRGSWRPACDGNLFRR